MAGQPAGEADHGIGTAVSEYSEGGPFHCGDCTHNPEGTSNCDEQHVVADPEVPEDANGRKVVNLETGCCRFVNPRGGGEDEEQPTEEDDGAGPISGQPS